MFLSQTPLRCVEWSRAAIRDARLRRSTVTAKPAERCLIDIVGVVVCKLMGFVVRNHNTQPAQQTFDNVDSVYKSTIGTPTIRRRPSNQESDATAQQIAPASCTDDVHAEHMAHDANVRLYCV